MRDDQLKRMADLSEKLADVVLEEADPDLWPGAGTPLADMSQQDRGNRYWSKKNAAATFALLARAEEVVDRIKNPEREAYHGEDLDRQIHDAEKRAEALLKKVSAKTKEATTGRKAHGKAP
jgi:hypothetical protein